MNQSESTENKWFKRVPWMPNFGKCRSSACQNRLLTFGSYMSCGSAASDSGDHLSQGGFAIKWPWQSGHFCYTDSS